MTDAINIVSDAKTKQQKRDEGRRRALEIAMAKQARDSNSSNDSTAKKLTQNKKRGNRKSERHGARNQHRHKHFARWILEKFPHIVTECSSSTETIENNMHVLDIAGGKGELSARLALCHSLRVVMIDPRKADIPSVYKNTVVPKLPKKWRHSLNERLQHTPTFIEDELDKRFSQLVTHFSIASNEIFCYGDGVASTTCDGKLFEDGEVEEAVRNASIIVGLHADGATEAIVDAALRYNKPFVVVPCCVFPNLFRHRFIYVESYDEASNIGEKKKVAVRTHEQFCQYLLDKDDRFRQEVLPFEGRNLAIWWDGK